MSVFKDSVVVVFGGTGTIGTLIVEYLMTQGCKTIRIFSNDENSLWEAEQRFGRRDDLRYLLGDIRDYRRTKQAVRGADFVFNCAAVKHVPKAEYNPIEAVRTNIIGLENIIEACVLAKVKKFLHISTDKAVEPVCIMGYTKAIGERLVQIRWSQNPQVEMVTVRLGNVWNSRGSIIQLVHELKKQQKPIPLTHLDMTRYFMQPEEVISFIVEAFENGSNGDIWVPKLKVVRIADILRGEVGIDYPFTEIGIRRGEKLSEKLLSDGECDQCEEFETHWVIVNELS